MNSSIRQIVRALLRIIPYGKKIEISIRYKINQRRNFGKIKFQGGALQDMIAYLCLKNVENGFYVDVGANDGICGSNTYIFEQLGWEGICVEPQPDMFRLLKKYRNCTTSSNENVEFLKVHGPANGLSRLVADSLKGGVDYSNSAKELGRVEYIKVKTMTFDEIMKNYPNLNHVDFLSIDTEGHEMEILRTIDFKKFSFGFMTIEGDEPEKIKYLEENGYKVFIKIGADTMFVPDN